MDTISTHEAPAERQRKSYSDEEKRRIVVEVTNRAHRHPPEQPYDELPPWNWRRSDAAKAANLPGVCV